MRNFYKKLNSLSDVTFEERLTRSRLNAGLTQAQLATQLGIDEKTYGKYEQGKADPSFRRFLDILETLEVSADYLVSGTITPANEQLCRLFEECPETKKKYLLEIISIFVTALNDN